MKLILCQATIAITETDFEPGPFRCQIELGQLDFAQVSEVMNFLCGNQTCGSTCGNQHVEFCGSTCGNQHVEFFCGNQTCASSVTDQRR